MSANINTYYGRRAAWHQLGTVTGHWMTWNELQNAGGLNWHVEKRQLLDPNTGRRVEAFGTFRLDTGAFLGPVGADYTPIPHQDGFEMVDQLVSSSDGAHYETAGCLGDGQIVWGLADLNRPINIGDDRSDSYLLFATAHDGSMSHTYRLTSTRVVCQNTLNLALSGRSAAEFRVRHTLNGNLRLQKAHQLLQTLDRDITAVADKLRILADRKATRETLTGMLDRLFPPTKTDDGKTVTSTRRANILADILRLYESNDRNAFPTQRGTLYNALNAVTAYADHMRGSDPAKRAEAALFGSGDALKTRAMDYLISAAETAPQRQAAPQVFAAPVSLAVMDAEPEPEPEPKITPDQQAAMDDSIRYLFGD